MGKPKKTREEIKERRRLAARQRRERIKNDPVLYEQSKIKDKERYYKRKRTRKILPVCEMSSENKNKVRKRNRENFRAYYRRKKEKAQLETIKEEVIEHPNKIEVNTRDPLETLLLPSTNKSVYSLRSNNDINREFLENCTENLQIRMEDELFQQSTSFKEEFPLKKSPISWLIPSTPRPSSAQSFSSDSNDTMLSLENNRQFAENIDTSEKPEQAASLSSTSSSLSMILEKTAKKFKRDIISPIMRLRRRIYKINKEMSHMRRKIDELQRKKEKYQKQAFRLRKERKNLDTNRTHKNK